VKPTVGLTFRFEHKAAPYRQALRDVGLDVVDLTPATPGATLAGLSGLVLSGGSDIEPGRYGQPMLGTRDPDPGRDALEMRLANEALAIGMPQLAICRGMQLLNVALGGTLLQDIGGDHTLKPPVLHRVDIVPGTRLHGILGENIDTNSRHHQAVDLLAEPLIRTATAPDGTVEGIEKPGQPFVLGVQWHPEDLPDRRLFWAFAEAVRLWKQ
jgi:putative glutamine amidotransferase